MKAVGGAHNNIKKIRLEHGHITLQFYFIIDYSYFDGPVSFAATCVSPNGIPVTHRCLSYPRPHLTHIEEFKNTPRWFRDRHIINTNVVQQQDISSGIPLCRDNTCLVYLTNQRFSIRAVFTHHVDLSAFGSTETTVQYSGAANWVCKEWVEQRVHTHANSGSGGRNTYAGESAKYDLAHIPILQRVG